jgi:hypothetical protein
MRGIRVAGRQQVSYTCSYKMNAPHVDHCEFYIRLTGGDDDAPVSLGPFWRRPMRIVGVAH